LVDDVLSPDLLEQAVHQKEVQHQDQQLERGGCTSQGEVDRSNSVARQGESDKKIEEAEQAIPRINIIDQLKSYARQMENITQVQEGLFKMQQELSNQFQALIAQCQ
jgi:hypothetical protein